MYLLVPLMLAGAALVAWAIPPANWANCSEYRYWVAPVSMPFMAGAAVEALWLRKSPERRLQDLRLLALPLVGAIFLLVLSIQCFQWRLVSRRFIGKLENSDLGCVSGSSIDSIRNTALDHWSVTLYAVELQGREPRTLLLPNDLACHFFALRGDAVFIEQGAAFTYVRRRREGWFDFEGARSRTGKLGR